MHAESHGQSMPTNNTHDMWTAAACHYRPCAKSSGERARSRSSRPNNPGQSSFRTVSSRRVSYCIISCLLSYHLVSSRFDSPDFFVPGQPRTSDRKRSSAGSSPAPAALASRAAPGRSGDSGIRRWKSSPPSSIFGYPKVEEPPIFNLRAPKVEETRPLFDLRGLPHRAARVGRGVGTAVSAALRTAGAARERGDQSHPSRVRLN